MKSLLAFRVADWLSHSRTRYGAMVVFVVLAFVFGGGSRMDITSLTVLRPVAFAFVFYALLVMRRGDLAEIRTPLFLLSALAVLLCVQMIPLPPGMWSALPGRAGFVQIYTAAGMDIPWLPLTVSSNRTLNSLMSLIVPAAALMLFAIQDPLSRTKLLMVLWVIAIISVIIGVFQLVGSPRGPLYFYRLTNNGLPVGLFANRNHQALMVAIGIVLSSYFIVTKGSRGRWGTLLATASGATLFLFLPFLLVAGSRAGLVTGGLMVLASLMLVYIGGFNGGSQTKPSQKKRKLFLSGATAVTAMLAIVFGAFVLTSRSLALDRLMASSQDELRAQIWPTIVSMIRSDWLFGRGFGTFDIAYKQVERVELLRPAYINHAHNDWAQWIIEGGVVAVAILVLFIVWLVRRALSLASTIRRGQRLDVLVAFLIVLACGVASSVDYPLRVPSLMVVFAIACGIISSASPKGGGLQTYGAASSDVKK